MSPERFRQVAELYHAVHEASPEKRAALLAQTDPQLRREIESLLKQRTGGEFLDQAAIRNAPELLDDGATVASVTVGTCLGPYRIESKLGEGGNLGPSDVNALFGIWENPSPVSLAQDSCTLKSGETHNCDVKGSEFAKKTDNTTGRVQMRAIVRCSSRTVGGTLEVFDNKTGRTTSLLALQEVPRE